MEEERKHHITRPEEFKAHKACIFGIQESGKTFWMQEMYKHFKKPLVLKVNEDDAWDKLPNIFVAELDGRDIQGDFAFWIKKARELAREGKIDLLIIDEADMFFRSNYDIDENLMDITLNHRHMGKQGLAVWFATRRPQDIPTRIVESCKFLVIFPLEGANAVKKFNEIDPRIVPKLEELRFKDRRFIIKKIGEEPYIHAPL